MHVYTPPGYEQGGTERYPVFYLLHGAGDSDDSWTSVGRAGFILDNLIASGRAKPMIVAMPAGHTSFADGAQPGQDAFFTDFTTALKPYVEEHYRVLTDRANTAIADLDNAALKPGTKLVWFGTGVDDGVIERSRATVDMLKSHGFDARFEESLGGHTWLNWRDYLTEFAPQLFQ